MSLIQSPHEALAKYPGIWKTIYAAQGAVDRAGAYYENIFRMAEKVGIKEGSEASRTIFRILNNVDGELILTKPLESVVPAELLSRLNPQQRTFVRIFKQIQNELADIRGLPKQQRIGAYITWMQADAQKHKYKDVLEQLKKLSEYRRPSKRVFDPFAQTRKTAGGDVVEDALQVMRTYTYYGLKKGFKEPTLRALAGDLKTLREAGGEPLAYTERWIMDWMGTSEKSRPIVEQAMKLWTGTVYKGTLYANTSAALTNLTQTLTATLPEIGPKWTARGFARFATESGRKQFLDSGVMADLMHGRKIGALDVFTRAEFVNRGVTYLGAYDKAIAKGYSAKDADAFARVAVEKTQFFLLGKVSAPEAFRRFQKLKPVLQFTQYPLGMTKRIASWARHNPQKLATWAAINVALGGPQALLPTDTIFYALAPDRSKDFLEKWRRQASLGGLLNVNLAPRFGFGIFPSLAPIPKAVYQGVKDFIYSGDPNNPSLIERLIVDEYNIDWNRDIVQSKTVQQNIPLFIPGGVQLKKVADNIGLPFSRYRYEDGMIIRRKDNRPMTEADVTDRIKKTFIGQPLKQAEAFELIRQTVKQKKVRQKAKSEAITQIVSNWGNPDKIKDNIITLYQLGYDDPDQIYELIGNEMFRQSNERLMTYAESLSKEDKAKFMASWMKIKQAYIEE
jgi:hypothetical protein